MDGRIGRVLSGNWRLDALLGEGGMANVYAGTHARNGLRVAVKVLHAHIGRNEEVRRRFLREGYVANKIDHPGVVRVLDDATDGEHVYLVMELLSGETLDRRWERSGRRLAPVEVERIVGKILEVLAKAHGLGVIHRDLKPDNVFLTTSGEVKLLDFGIARIRDEQAVSEFATAAGAMMGTPAFMPAEQALGQWDSVDARSDLYSVAASAFTLLTGNLVHTASSVPELLVLTATRPAPKLRAVDPSVPERLAAVLDRALSFRQEDRWPDASSMLAALRGLPPPSPGAGALAHARTVELASVREPETPRAIGPRALGHGPTMQSERGEGPMDLAPTAQVTEDDLRLVRAASAPAVMATVQEAPPDPTRQIDLGAAAAMTAAPPGTHGPAWPSQIGVTTGPRGPSSPPARSRGLGVALLAGGVLVVGAAAAALVFRPQATGGTTPDGAAPAPSTSAAAPPRAGPSPQETATPVDAAPPPTVTPSADAPPPSSAPPGEASASAAPPSASAASRPPPAGAPPAWITVQDCQVGFDGERRCTTKRVPRR